MRSGFASEMKEGTRPRAGRTMQTKVKLIEQLLYLHTKSSIACQDMLDGASSVKVAVVQDAPVAFDLKQSIEKVLNLTEKATGQGADLICFP